MKFAEIFASKITKGVLIGIGAVLVVLVIFQLGMLAGYHKASFAFHGSEQYYQTFGRPQRSDMTSRVVAPEDFDNSHGAIGKVVSVSLPMFTVQDTDKAEKIVSVGADTTVRKLRDTLKPEDIKVNDQVVVIGDSNSKGQIDAKLVRIVPDSAQAPAPHRRMPPLPFFKKN